MSASNSLFPAHLRCERETNPLGIDEPQPRFSWCLDTTQKGAVQTAYRIIVSTSIDKLVQDMGDLWDTGRIISSSSVSISYEGVPLISRQRIWWKIKLWNEKHDESEFSEPAWFEMGLLSPLDWVAEWMGCPGGNPARPLLFRCSFQNPLKAQVARLYITGLGFHEAFINGHRLGDSVLDPIWTDPQKRVFYRTHDITGLLREGENVIAATVGAGWHGQPVLLAQLEIKGKNGQSIVVATGESRGESNWLVSSGPILSSSIYDGEVYDARIDIAGWNAPKYDLKKTRDRSQQWLPAYRMMGPEGQLRAQPAESIKIVRELAAKSVSEPKPGVFVFDFLQNHAGWVKLHVRTPRTTTITLRYAESLHTDGTVNQENLRRALATDSYTTLGNDTEEIWSPSFTYHGYRYVQVEGWPGIPNIGDLTSEVIRNSVQERGTFECSHELLNRLHHVIRWTEESNLHGVPTDCPQRDERMGWLNDLAARTEELVLNFDTARFMEKFVADIADAQDSKSGAICDTVPFLWGHRPADPVGVCYLLIPFLLYQHNRNHQLLDKSYDGLARWVSFLGSQCEGDLLRYSYYGDWAPPASQCVGETPNSAWTPGDLVSSAFYCYSLQLMEQISIVLGRRSNADEYRTTRTNTSQAFHQAFWNPDINGYGSGNQACNAIALYFDLVPTPLRKKVVDSLIRDVEKQDYHLTTGNLATKYLLEVLSNEGHIETAFKIAAQTTYPSWGYMIEQGATTLWERWELLTGGGMNSHNHPMFGSVGAWLYRWVAGITIAESNHSSPHFFITVPALKELSYCRSSLQTDWGQIAVFWHREDNRINVSVEVPWNCRATLRLLELSQEIGSGRYTFSMQLSSSGGMWDLITPKVYSA
jgi:alpha-L-rhamnosidase